MRDILDKLDELVLEASTLAPSEITKHEWRFRKVIDKIEAGDPFEDKTGTEIIIDPQEARKLTQLYRSGQLVGSVSVRTVDEQGNPAGDIPLSALKKTPELQKPSGGATTATGQRKITKEDALLKPSQIGITDRDIPAKDLYETIVSNTVLNSTDYGRAVIGMATDIANGRAVKVPEQYQTKDNEQLRKAMVDYAGEYLGVLALVMGQTVFPKKNQFLAWLGGDLGNLVLRFPSKANTNLADSYASITNPDTQHTLNISSKGTGGGAAPAVSGLKIPDNLRKSRKLKPALDFITICQSSDRAGGPTTITSAFDAIDLIYEVNPKSLPQKIQKLLPLKNNPKLMPFVVQAIRNKDMTPLPKKYDVLIQDVKSKSATPSGKLVYALKNTVQDAINNHDGIPSFRDTILQILEMNFIQQYADYDAGTIGFATQWPAKLEGDISLEHKSSAVSPTDGGFSFKLGRPENFGADTDLGDPGPQDNPEPEDLDKVSQRRTSIRARREPQEPQPDEKIFGRKKR